MIHNHLFVLCLSLICTFEYIYHDFAILKSLFKKAAEININRVFPSFTPIYFPWNTLNIDYKINPKNALVYLALVYHRIHFRNCKMFHKQNIAKDWIQLLVCVLHRRKETKFWAAGLLQSQLLDVFEIGSYFHIYKYSI